MLHRRNVAAVKCSSKTLQGRNVAVVKRHSRRNIGWTYHAGKNIAWSFSGQTIHQGTVQQLSNNRNRKLSTVKALKLLTSERFRKLMLLHFSKVKPSKFQWPQPWKKFMLSNANIPKSLRNSRFQKLMRSVWRQRFNVYCTQ